MRPVPPLREVGDVAHDIHVERHPPDRAIAEIAARQHSVVARRQLVRLGLGRGAIAHRVRVGRLFVVHTGVYCVGNPRPTGRALSMAAVLRCGPGALLSHRSAADLWALLEYAGSYFDVTVPRGGRRPRDGVRLHRPNVLRPEDRAVVEGIPVTGVARTLVDLASVVNARRLRRAVEEADRRRLFDLRAIVPLLTPGRRHAALKRVLADYTSPPHTRSELETRFVEFCRERGLPMPALNVAIGDHEVDAVWLPQRLVVELDSRGSHGHEGAYERDRIKDAALQMQGFRVLRITYGRLAREPQEVDRAIQALLDLHPIG